MKIAAIITARHNSKRLPKKHMLKLGELRMIEILIKRLQQNNNQFSIILCTTKDKSDYAFEEISTQLKIDCYRGYLHNVKGRVLKAAKKFNVDWEKYGPVFAVPKRPTWFWDPIKNMWSGAELIERTQRFMRIVVESSLGYPIKMLTEHGEPDKKKGVKTLLGELLDMSRDEGKNSKKLKSSRTKTLLPATTPQDIRKRKEKDWMDPDVDEEEELDTWVATTPPTPLHLLFQIIRDAYTQCTDNNWLDDD